MTAEKGAIDSRHVQRFLVALCATAALPALIAKSGCGSSSDDDDNFTGSDPSGPVSIGARLGASAVLIPEETTDNVSVDL